MLTVIAEKENISGDMILIDDRSECNHIQNVYRMSVGNRVRVVDGEYEYRAEIISIGKKEIRLRKLERINDSYSLAVNIDVALGIIKNDRMKLAIQKLTEIGINRIIPLETERVVVKIREKKEKWDSVVRESLKQCKGVKFTEVTGIETLQSINYDLYDRIFYAYEKSEGLTSLSGMAGQGDRNILYIVGPEGGFTEMEARFLKEAGGIEISLGKRILRAETAAIVIGGILADVYR